jgi:hypothetical protein
MRHLKYWIGLGIVLGAMVSAQAQASWTLRNASLPGRTLRGIASTGTQLVAVGDTGTILTSSTGAAWTLRPSNTTSILFAVAAGPDLLVAVGANGVVRTSPDGITWTTRATTVTGTFYGAAYGNGRYVAVGVSGNLVSSVDGIEWAARPSGVGGTLRAVTWSNGQFVAVGDGGIVSTSSDGISWTGRNMGAGVTTSFYGIGASNGQFMAVGGGGAIRTSSDGVTWTPLTSKVASILNAVHRADGLWIVAGDGGVILTSSDGSDWTTRTSTATALLAGVGSLGGVKVVVGGTGTVRLSGDGLTWASPPALSANLNSVAHDAAKGFVAVGDASNALTSTDAIVWTKRTLASSQPAAGVLAAPGGFIAVGGNGTLQTSATGASWTTGNSGTTKVLYSVATSGNFYVGVAAEGKYITSPDGAAWTERSSPVTTNLYSVTYGNGQFVAVGAGGVILVSSNGTSWTSRGTSAFTGVLNSVTWAESQGLYIAVGAGAIYTSPTGTTWTPRTSPVSNTILYGVGNTGTFVTAVGANGTIITSADGVTWRIQSSGITSTLYSVTSSDSTIVAVGTGGVVMSARKGALPSVPAQTSPANAATAVPVRPHLTWGAAANATYYRVQIATESSFASPVVNDSVSGTSWSALQLSGNATYYWRVAAANSLGMSAYSSSRSFTTGAAPTAPPVTPTLISPTLFATGVTTPVTLTWSASAGTEFYRVQVSTSPNLNSGPYVAHDSMVTTTSYTLPTLAGGTNHYWRVNARNSLGTSAFPEAFMFQTLLQKPGKPTLLTPTGFSTNVNRATSMTWSAVSGASTYHIYLSIASDFGTVLVQDSTLTGTTYKPPFTLAPSTDFYWRVRAKNAAGTGDWSTAATFETGTTSSIASGPGLARFARMGGNEYLRFSLAAPGRVSVRVFDSQGRLLARVLDENRGGGEHTIRLPEGLGNALQFLEFRSGEGREWLKIHP